MEHTPFFRRSAFRAWFKNTMTTLITLVTVVTTTPDLWKPALVVSAGSVVKDFLGSAWEIIFGEESYRQE